LQLIQFLYGASPSLLHQADILLVVTSVRADMSTSHAMQQFIDGGMVVDTWQGTMIAAMLQDFC